MECVLVTLGRPQSRGSSIISFSGRCTGCGPKDNLIVGTSEARARALRSGETKGVVHVYILQGINNTHIYLEMH